MAFLLAGAALACAAGPALADPCRAVPQKGPMSASLARGERFSGPVVHIADGDSLCVAVGPRRGADWVEVRLADFHAPELKAPGGREARDALKGITGGVGWIVSPGAGPGTGSPPTAGWATSPSATGCGPPGWLKAGGARVRPRGVADDPRVSASAASSVGVRPGRGRP